MTSNDVIKLFAVSHPHICFALTKRILDIYS